MRTFICLLINLVFCLSTQKDLLPGGKPKTLIDNEEVIPNPGKGEFQIQALLGAFTGNKVEFKIKAVVARPNLNLESDLVFCIGTNTLYFCGINTFDGGIGINNIPGALFVTPKNGSPLIITTDLVGQAKVAPKDPRKNLVDPHKQSIFKQQWELLAGAHTPFSDGDAHGEPLDIYVYIDRGLKTTTIAFSKGGATVSVKYSSTWSATDKLKLFMDPDSKGVEELKILELWLKEIPVNNHGGCANGELGFYKYTDDVYACRGTFDGSDDNGIFGPNAQALCKGGYKVCRESSAVAGGLTKSMCEEHPYNSYEFFGAKYSSNGNGLCGNPDGYNDIWGCGSMGETNTPCGPFNRRLGTAANDSPYPGWSYDDSWTESKTAKLSNPNNGGVLCCKIKSGHHGCGGCTLEYPCVHDNDGSCLPKMEHGGCWPGSTICAELFLPDDATDPCYFCDKTYPCLHNNTGDNICHQLQIGRCPSGTIVCPNYSHLSGFLAKSEVNILDELKNDIKSEIFFDEIGIAIGVFIVGILFTAILMCCIYKYYINHNTKKAQFEQVSTLDN